MKRLKTSLKSTSSIQLGLSEDEQHYCLVQNNAQKFTVFWQKKPCDLASFIQQNISMSDDVEHNFTLIRPIPHQYIWRKIVFLPKTLSSTQLHQQVIHILKNEQPLSIELLNFDYQKFPSSNLNLNKIVIYALHKDYAKNLMQSACILDCELHCYVRAIAYFNNQTLNEQLCFQFKQKFVKFTETELQFLSTDTTDCLLLENIAISDAIIESDTDKHLYLLALGASLWNGKALI